jgi:hypothetical protein
VYSERVRLAEGQLENGISIKVIWFDEDLLEVLCSCSNGYFSGLTEFYLAHDAPSQLASTLSGFPSSAADYRDFELGAFKPNHAGGGVLMHFYCVDSVGHAAVYVKLKDGGRNSPGEIQSVALHILIEAAGVDNFVQQLKAMGKTIGAGAFLRQAK